MNAGPVAIRYAEALLKYVTSTGHGETVYAQVREILADPARSGEPLDEDLVNFVSLLVKNGRMEYVKRIFQSFIRLYDKANDIHQARLLTATGSSEIQKMVESFAASKIDGKLDFKTSVDPSLIGGFILEIDDYRMDASVSRQLDVIQRQLTIKNKCIV